MFYLVIHVEESHVIKLTTLDTVDMFQYGHSEAGGVEHVPEGWNYWVGLVRFLTLQLQIHPEAPLCLTSRSRSGHSLTLSHQTGCVTNYQNVLPFIIYLFCVATRNKLRVMSQYLR